MTKLIVYKAVLIFYDGCIEGTDSKGDGGTHVDMQPSYCTNDYFIIIYRKS